MSGWFVPKYKFIMLLGTILCVFTYAVLMHPNVKALCLRRSLKTVPCQCPWPRRET